MSSYDDIIGKRKTQPQEVEPDAPQKGMIDYGTPGQKVVLGPEDKEPDAAQGGGSTGGDVITGGDNTAGTAATPTDTGNTTPQPRRYLGYDDIQQELKRQEEIMKRNRPETDAEREQRERREKRNKMFAALGDGISALSNLYFTTKGAPNMYNPSTSLSEAAQRRIEMARQAREKELAAYNAAATARYGTLTDADSRAYKWDTMARQKQQDADNKARKDALAEAQAGKYKAAQDKDEAMTAYYEAQERAILEGLPLKKAVLVADAAKKRAEARRADRQGTSSWVGGSKGGSGGGSGSSKYSLFNEQTGQTETFATKGEQMRRAGELGYDTGTTSSSSSESDDGYGTKKTTNTSRSSNAAEANIGRQEAEAKRRYAEKQRAASKSKQQQKSKTAPAKPQGKSSGNKKWASGLKL